MNMNRSFYSLKIVSVPAKVKLSRLLSETTSKYHSLFQHMQTCHSHLGSYWDRESLDRKILNIVIDKSDRKHISIHFALDVGTETVLSFKFQAKMPSCLVTWTIFICQLLMWQYWRWQLSIYLEHILIVTCCRDPGQF